MEQDSTSEVFLHSDYSTAYPEGIQLHFWNRTRNKIVYRLLRSLVQEDELVMDVGCGPGIFLGYLQGTGIQARGVEKGSPEINASLAEVIDLDTDLFDLPQSLKAQIEVIVLLDVIEHIGEPRQFLKNIYREIPNCKQLLITVPARMEIWSNYDREFRHFTRYSRSTLCNELNGTGFEATYSRYFFHSLYLLMRVLKLLRLNRSTQTKPPTRNAAVKFLHWMLGALLYLEFRLVPGGVPGSSLLCVASRK